MLRALHEKKIQPHLKSVRRNKKEKGRRVDVQTHRRYADDNKSTSKSASQNEGKGGRVLTSKLKLALDPKWPERQIFVAKKGNTTNIHTQK